MSKNVKKDSTPKNKKSTSFCFLRKDEQHSFEAHVENLFYQDLSSALSIWTDVEARTFAIERARERSFKKLKSGHTPELVNVALTNFRRFNKDFQQPELGRPKDFGFTVLDFHHRYLEDILDVAENWIFEAIEGFTRRNSKSGIRQNVLDFDLLTDRLYFGPKASVGWNADLPAVEKITTLTTTQKAATYFGLVAEAFHSADSDVISNAHCALKVVDGGKLGTVPKDKTKCRVIMTEPSLNGALQLAAGAYLRDVLSERGLIIQGYGGPAAMRNNKIASIASRFWESKLYATLDLKNASDSLSDALVARLMPKPWYEFLKEIRSENVTITDKGVSVTERLNVFCTMGNGFTFPLQTLIFTSLAVGLRAVAFNVTPDYLLSYKDDKLGALKVSVFGDDIIVPQKLASQMVDLLNYVGLVVNDDKSFVKGPFFESCGGDYFKGSDVTPCYVRDLKTRAGLSVAFNSLLGWSAAHYVDLSNTLYFIARRLYESKSFNFIPTYHGPDQGILYPSVKPRTRTYTVFCVVPRTVTMPNVEFGLTMYRALSGSYATEFSTRDVKPFPLKSATRDAYLRGGTPSIVRKIMDDSYGVQWTLAERQGRDPRYRGSTHTSSLCWWSTKRPYISLGEGIGQRERVCHFLERLALQLSFDKEMRGVYPAEHSHSEKYGIPVAS